MSARGRVRSPFREVLARAVLAFLSVAVFVGWAGGCAGPSLLSVRERALFERTREQEAALDANYARAEKAVLARREQTLSRLERLRETLLAQVRSARRLDELDLLARGLALEPDAEGRTRLDGYLGRARAIYRQLECELVSSLDRLLALHRRESDEQLALLEAEREHKRRWLHERLARRLTDLRRAVRSGTIAAAGP